LTLFNMKRFIQIALLAVMLSFAQADFTNDCK
jgi:hypothetical protein